MKKLAKRIEKKEFLLKFDDSIKPVDLAEIIWRLYRCKDQMHYNRNSGIRKDLTYNTVTGKKFGNFDARSLQDLYKLAKYYLPDITKEQISLAMTVKLRNCLRGTWCCTSKRVQFRPNSISPKVENWRSSLDELNLIVK